MARIKVDNKDYEVADGQNLLQACLALGFNLPYFCWHPAMHSVGACRQCAVKQFRDENDTRGRIVMACMTPASDGTRISIEDEEAKAFRRGVIEWLMINHPHDCPVCDEGGECHLQDMTLMAGHNYRRYRFAKRTYRNQYLGPFVNHEMNRCIQCYRCVRFYRDYAGGKDFDVFGAHDHVYFGRHQNGVLESEFAGNLAEVCPTGVFTDATLKRHYTRKWDLETAPSVCVHCSLGCNIVPGARYGMLRRIRNRFNGAVNGYFLCDRGRYGYEFVNGEQRLRVPIRRAPNGDARPEDNGRNDRHAVVSDVAAIFRTSRRAIGIGSPRASLEANFALRTLVGPQNFYQGASSRDARLVESILEILRAGPARTPSLREVESHDAVFVLGEDITNYAPVLALSLRQAVRREAIKNAETLRIPYWDDSAVRELAQDRFGPLFLATVAATKLDEVAAESYVAATEDLARLGFAVARALGGKGREPSRLEDRERKLAADIAKALKAAERPLIVSGASLGSETIVRAAANVAQALCELGRPAGLTYSAPECNSLGTAIMGGGHLDDALGAITNGDADTVIVLENDLYRRSDSTIVDRALSRAKHVITLDSVGSKTVDRSDIVLPTGSFAESDGTLVNNEGRAQRFYQVLAPADGIQESWRWLRDVMQALGPTDVGAWHGLDDVIAALCLTMPQLSSIAMVAPRASYRVAGMKIPRQSQRYSGRTAMHADEDVSEHKPPDDPDSALSFSMEGFDGQPPSPLIPRFWAPGWNSNQAVNKFQSEIGGALKGGDPGVRLIEPSGTEARYFEATPAAFEPRAGQLLLLPLYHIFGSEELSAQAPPVAELAPEPYIAINPLDAEAAGLTANQKIEVVIGSLPRQLLVKLVETTPPGTAGMPAGLPALIGIELPAWISLKETG